MEELHTPYEQDSILRREAGEGWHPTGIDETLLAALADRESFVDEIIAKGGLDRNPELEEHYLSQAEHVKNLKAARGITEPPMA